MTSVRSNFSLAVAATGLFAFVFLASGVWHKKIPAGGLTQVGRHASVTFEDGSVMDLDEPETDLAILQRRRMANSQGKGYRQIFITSDGREINVLNNRPAVSEDSEDLNSGDHLILAANTLDAQDVPPPLDSRDAAAVDALQLDGKDHANADEVDPKDRVTNAVIDGKDVVTTDYKDAKDAPVFALTPSDESLLGERLDMLLMGDGGIWGDIRTAADTGIIGSGTGATSPGGGGAISIPPIGSAVPEPSALPMISAAGALGLAFAAWHRRGSAGRA